MLYLSSCRLCKLIIVFIFGMQLQLIFTVFLLKTFWNLLGCVKCSSNKDRECFPTFVTIFVLYGGLKHILFPFHFLVAVWFDLMWYFFLKSVFTYLHFKILWASFPQKLFNSSKPTNEITTYIYKTSKRLSETHTTKYKPFHPILY